MFFVNLSGPINAGKTTVGRLLPEMIGNAVFVDVDELLPDEEQMQLGLGFHEGIALRLDRLDSLIEREKRLRRYRYLFFAYPMSWGNFRRWKAWENGTDRVICITLSPSFEICIGNRGGRELSAWEIKRIGEMYKQGYHNLECSDLIICNDKQSPKETAEEIRKFLFLF